MKSPVNSSQKHQRFDIDLSAKFRVVGSIEWHDGRILNLSEGGVCLATRNGVDPEQIVELIVETVDRFSQPHLRRIMAKIVWQNEQRHGLKFLRTASVKNSSY